MIINTPDASHIPALRRLWKQAFGDTDAFLDSFFSIAFSPERCRCAFADGEPVAALYWFDCRLQDRKLAYLYAVATHKDFQNRGFCRALMENTHAHLRKQDYDAAILVPFGQSLFRFYEKLGYRTATHIREFSCAAGNTPATLQPLDGEKYAALRREYLPHGGVRQEGAALALLQDQARFYAGDGFLLIAAWENGDLRLPEFLGDTAFLPGAIAALDATAATVRTPGTGKPFSMFLPLSDALQPFPAYFGLALD